jgi:hypothetical protein
MHHFCFRLVKKFPVAKASKQAEKARNVYHMVQNSTKSSPNVFYKKFVHIWDFAKKIDLSAAKMARNGRFRENAPAYPSSLETYPWWCYALKYGRNVEGGPLE